VWCHKGKHEIQRNDLADEMKLETGKTAYPIGGRYVHAVHSTGRSDCPSVRKSVRFEIGTAPFVLQLSGGTSRNITVPTPPREEVGFAGADQALN
jgi:hypothetical protein